MKKIILGLLLCFPLAFIGQISASKANTKTPQQKVMPATYAEVVMSVYSPEKQKISVNFGKKDEKSQKYSKAAKMEFLSLTDAFNAMSAEGFKLVDSYEIEGKDGKYIHFIMVKEQTRPQRPSRPARPTQTRK